MKRIRLICLALCLALLLAAGGAACGKKTDPPGTESGSAEESFEKPEQYDSVLVITINPQFRLYLDENGKVLELEAMNEDAESMKDSIDFENQSYETVIETIVTSAYQKGFVKENATIKLEIAESSGTGTAQAEILAQAEKKVTDTADGLNITVNVEESRPDNDSDSTESRDEESQESSETESQVEEESSEPEHVHSFSAATCTQPKKCACGAVEGKALGHDYKNGVCTRCKAADPNFSYTSVLEKRGSWKIDYIYKNDLYSGEISVCNSNGSLQMSVGIGVLLSGLPEEMQEDAKPYCVIYNNQEYYIGMGDGSSLSDVKEEEKTVTLTDQSGNELVLTRTGEKKLEVVSVSEDFAVLKGLSKGMVFTFEAE